MRTMCIDRICAEHCRKTLDIFLCQLKYSTGAAKVERRSTVIVSNVIVSLLLCLHKKNLEYEC